MKIPEVLIKEVEIQIEEVSVKGILSVPDKASSIIIFSHGSGSSRFSPRNRYIAEILNYHGMATLMVDLLTPEEDEVFENRFNMSLLTKRLIAVTKFIHHQEAFREFSIAYIGASTGAASALGAAALLPELIAAVVSRGGRPDLAEAYLPKVKAPTLLIVGGYDTEVIEINKAALKELTHCVRQIRIVEGATHLFEEPGKLEEVSHLACRWMQQYMPVQVISRSN